MNSSEIENEESSSQKLLSNIEQSILFYQKQLRKGEDEAADTESGKKKSGGGVHLVDRDEYRKQLNDLFVDLIESRIGIIKKHVLSKSFTKKAVNIKETCVRLLTLCVQHNMALAKQVAVEFQHFNEHKNWLEKCLLMKQTYLRELCVEFLLSFLKYVGKTTASSTESDTQHNTNREHILLIKKIFLNIENDSAKHNNNSSAKSNELSLTYCLFAHVATDSKDSIEFLLQELLFKLVQNDHVTKSEKVKLFNEKNLLNLIKLYEWRHIKSGDQGEEDEEPLSEEEKLEQALQVRQMINEFLKVLFCSTRFGINFHDRTLNVDQSSKNQNHLIFNTILNINRFGLMNKKTFELNSKTNEMIDDLLLRVFKVCPDLIQRFLKIKYKQEQNKTNTSTEKESSGDSGSTWFLQFATNLFEQQYQMIKGMSKNIASNTSFLRSFASVDLQSSLKLSISNQNEEIKSFLCNLIVHTSIPLCFSFQKLFVTFNSKDPATQIRYDHSLRLLIASLKCLKEWKSCLKRIQFDSEYVLSGEDESASQRRLIVENLSKAFVARGENNLFIKLNMDLITKHLPKFDAFTSLNKYILAEFEKEDNKPELLVSNLNDLFEIFTLYFDIFMGKYQRGEKSQDQTETIDADDLDIENEDETNICFNMLQTELFENDLIKLIPKILGLNSSEEKMETDESNPSDTTALNLSLSENYLNFLIKYQSLKQHEEYLVIEDESLTVSTVSAHSKPVINSSSSPQVDLNGLRVVRNSDYTIDYRNQSLLNLVRIIVKFNRSPGAFKHLVQRELDLISVYLQNDEQNYSPNDIRDYMYLWLVLVRKYLNSETIKPALFSDFIYICLYNLLETRQRVKVQSGLDFNQLSQLVAFVSLKSFTSFSEKLNGISELGPSIQSIQSFLFDYLLTSCMIATEQISNLKLQFEKVLEKDKSEFAKGLMAQLDTKLSEISSQVANHEKVKINGEKMKLRAYSQALMYHFDKTTDLKSAVENNETDLLVTSFNLNLRVRHLVYLLNRLFSKDDQFDIEKDLDLVLSNLINCSKMINEMSKFDRNADYLFKLVLNNSVLVDNAFHNSSITDFLRQTWQEVLCNNSNVTKYFEVYVERFLGLANDKQQSSVDFIKALNLSKATFKQMVDRLSSEYGHLASHQLDLFLHVLIKHQNYIFEENEKENLTHLEQLNASLTPKQISAVQTFDRCIRVLLHLMTQSDSDLTSHAGLDQFLSKAIEIRPISFKVFIADNPDLKKVVLKQLKKLVSSRHYTIIKSSQDDLIVNDEANPEDYSNISKLSSVNSLLEQYKYTLSGKDVLILRRIAELDPKLNCMMFKLVSDDHKELALNKQVKLADFVAATINDQVLSASIHNYPLDRRLDSLADYDKQDSSVYDPVYIIPNLYNLLDYANIVDVLHFVQGKLLSYLFASLSSECPKLRSLSYGCFYRFMLHLENSHVYFKNTVIYLINLLRNSLQNQNQRLPTVVSVFLAEAVQVIIEPGTILYKPIMSFLLLKPALDLTNVPEFYKLFNSSSLQYKAERKWILSILAVSCRTSLDYRLYEKRFIYRQLMSIYDSTLSDTELKGLILDLIYRTCSSSRYALIDLIKRHYLLVWLTSVLESSRSSSSSTIDSSKVNLFYKLLLIYNKIWSELGQRKDESQPAPPITFLNQMSLLANSARLKLIAFYSQASVFQDQLTKSGIKSQFDKQVKQFFVIGNDISQASSLSLSFKKSE